MSATPEICATLAAQLEALAAAGAKERDPVGYHTIETMLGRASGQSAAVRRHLEARIQCRLQALARLHEAAPAAPAPACATAPPALAELLRALSTGEPTDNADELRTVRAHRATWAALHIDKQFAEARVCVPDNAGPLNSHHLVLRALETMHTVAPPYLRRFMTHIDALLTLEQAIGASQAATKPRKAAKRRT